MEAAQLSQEDLLILNLRLKLSNVMQLVSGLSMEIFYLGPPRNRNLPQSTYTAVHCLSRTLNRLSKGSEQAISLLQMTIKEGGPNSRRIKLSLNNGKERIGQQAWNQLGGCSHSGGMHPVIFDTSLEAVKFMNQH